MIKSISARHREEQEERERQALRDEIKAQLEKERQGNVVYTGGAAGGYIYVTTGTAWTYGP